MISPYQYAALHLCVIKGASSEPAPCPPFPIAQDQFILQMISLMDRLLKRENLDLRLTPYKVGLSSCVSSLC